MPIYEFQCQACGTVIEVLQKISDPHITDCAACGKEEMKKKVTAAAFRLSGSGWYETDFKESDKKKNLAETKAENKDQKTTGESGSGEGAKSGDSSNAAGGSKSADSSTVAEGSKSSKEGSSKTSDKVLTKTDTSSTTKKE